jgi:hypothetical protein
MVLQPADMSGTRPAESWGLDFIGIRTYLPAVPDETLRRWRPIRGYHVVYGRGGPAATPGALSHAVVYKDDSGARSDLNWVRRNATKASQPGMVWKQFPTRGALGQSACGFQAVGPEVTTIRVDWRYKNIRGTIVTSNRNGSIRPADVIDLARRQQARIIRARG